MQGDPDATSLALVPRVDTRTQGVPKKETDQQDDRQKLIATLVRTILSDPDKDKLIEELQESRYNELSLLKEEAKEKIHSQGYIECVEFCVLSVKIQCTQCLRCSTPGNLDGRCCTIFVKEHEGSEAPATTRELNRRWFKWLKIPNYTLKKSARRGARHGSSQAQCEKFQAQQCYYSRSIREQ